MNVVQSGDDGISTFIHQGRRRMINTEVLRLMKNGSSFIKPLSII